MLGVCLGFIFEMEWEGWVVGAWFGGVWVRLGGLCEGGFLFGFWEMEVEFGWALLGWSFGLG